MVGESEREGEREREIEKVRATWVLSGYCVTQTDGESMREPVGGIKRNL
jgi:hypothetical protein